MKRETKPLTARERFVIKEMRLEKVLKRNQNSPYNKIVVQRNESEIRSILKSRARGSGHAQRAYEGLRKVMVDAAPYKEVEAAYWGFHGAMKYQGYLKMAYVIAMARTEGKTEQEIEAMLLLEVL